MLSLQAETQLDLRRKMRMQRLEMVKARVHAKALEEQKKEEERKRKESLKQKKQFDMSEHARCTRAFEWYNRCGTVNRQILKGRVAAMPFSFHGLRPQDIDLLPWDDNGQHVDLLQVFAMLF